MKEEQKKTVLEKYKLALQKGERFWPDSIFKDVLVSLAIFIVLILLATFMGVPGEPKADPSDSAFIPRPEWYFLFLFKFLAIFGQIPLLGKIEWIATAVIPGLVIVLLLALPLLDRNPYRHYSRRTMALGIMAVFVVSMVVLTVISNIPAVSGDKGMSTMTLLQFLTGLVIPLVAYIVLIGSALLPNKATKGTSRLQVWTAGTASVLMGITALGVVLIAPPVAASTGTQTANTIPQKMALGQDLYSINCAQCHGSDGEGGVILGVAGLDGFKMKAIHSQDEMYTRADDTLAAIISYGQPNLGMQPFGKVNGGALSPTEIDSIVTFMRYTWDDRAQIPAGATITGSIPVLNPGEVPSWDVHIQPLIKRYCISCHQAGKENNNYLMTSYQEVLTSGDNAPLITAGDPKSLLLLLINGHQGLDPINGKTIRQMPPTKLLDQQYIDMLTSWVMNGMPQTAADTAKATPTPGTGDAINLTGDAAAGLVVYTAQCEKCHGTSGLQGVDNPGSTDGTVPALNPIDPGLVSTDLKTYVTNLDPFLQNGSTPEGSSPKLLMPAYGKDGVLTQQQIADVMAYIIALNNAPNPTPTSGPGAAIDLTGDATAGMAVYTAQCEKCHGTSGLQGVDNPGSTDGTVPALNPIDPALINADLKIYATNLDLFLQNGSTPAGSSPKLLMPDYGKEGILTQQQIADVIAYVISLNNTPGPGAAINLTGDATAGLAVYTAQCVKCHGANGLQGVDNPGSTDGTVPALNPIDPEIKNADTKTFITNIDMFLQNGSTPDGPSPKLLMPAYGKDAVITQQQIADVIAYLISLNP